MAGSSVLPTPGFFALALSLNSALRRLTSREVCDFAFRRESLSDAAIHVQRAGWRLGSVAFVTSPDINRRRSSEAQGRQVEER